MQPIATVCLLVCLCVTTVSHAKTAEPIGCRLGCGLEWAQELCIRLVSDLPTGRGTFEGDDIRIFPRVAEHRPWWL